LEYVKWKGDKGTKAEEDNDGGGTAVSIAPASRTLKKVRKGRKRSKGLLRVPKKKKILLENRRFVGEKSSRRRYLVGGELKRV